MPRRLTVPICLSEARMTARAWLIALALVVTAVALAAPARADLAAVSTVAAAPGLDPAGTGLAAWYQDANGMQLTVCEDGTPACFGATPAALTDPAAGELFYSRAVADFTGPSGERFVEVLSLQAAPDTGGKPIAFLRIRFRLVPGQPHGPN